MLITEELIHRIERVDAEWLSQSVIVAGGDVLRVGSGTAAFAGDGNVLTQAVGVHQDLEAVCAHYVGRCRQFEFKLSPLAPAEVCREAARRATGLQEFETILVRSPDSLPESAPLPAGSTLEELDKRDLFAYVGLTERWFFGEAGSPGFVETIAPSLTLDITRIFVVRWEDRIVGGGCLTALGGVAYLHSGAVDPDFRNRGLHRALIQARLRYAPEFGVDVVVQGALPGSTSQLNAQRNGFVVAFTRPTLLISGI